MAAYQELYSSGELEERVEQVRAILRSCELCPNRCRVNRLQGETGKCHTASEAVVSSYGPHPGEEAPLVGTRGSGTIFFTHCNLRCVYCQNHTISQMGQGVVASREELATAMLSLQRQGCLNINLVTPTHVLLPVLEALQLAAGLGLSLPLVYNCGGYESVETLQLLDGIIDIYMPDMKYSDERNARRFSGIKDYPQVNRQAVKEMHRQVGDLVLDEHGVAKRGLLVRHLVLPNGIAGTEGVVRFIAQDISLNTYLNVMAQYHPCNKAFEIPSLSRPLTGEEFADAVKLARQYGLERLDGVKPRSLASLL